MKIGLVRHFKVNHPFPGKTLLSKSEVIKWFEEYDLSEQISVREVDLGATEWKRCYSSTMIRAVTTAKHIYQGAVEQSAELQEFASLHRLPAYLRLPFMIWALIVRMQSLLPGRETRAFRKNIAAFVDQLIANNEGDVLVVSHWFVMRIIRKELMNRGFAGRDFVPDDYGRLYIFERS